MRKLNNFFLQHQPEIIILVGVALISLLSFALGFITAEVRNRSQLKVEQEILDY